MSETSYLQPYLEALARHGPAFGATLWASEEMQRRRFEILAELVSFGGRRVLDVGSGLGDLPAWLLEEGVEPARWTGVEALPELVAHANGRGLPRCTFFTGDVLAEPTLLALHAPEVIVVSGTLNTMNEAQVLRLLGAAWGATAEALAFNFLSDLTTRPPAPEGDPTHRQSTLRLLHWALARTTQVAFRQDYLRFGYDATIVMRRT